MSGYEKFVGSWVEDGRRVRLYVLIGLHPQGNGPYQTMDHDLRDDVLRLSISGHTTSNGYERSGGQIVDDLELVTEFGPGWDAESVAELARLWRRWHLNDMRAACAHQEPDGDLSIGQRLDATPDCPETGYRYGTRWLIEEIPDDELEAIHRLQRRP